MSLWSTALANSTHQTDGGWSRFENISQTSVASTFPTAVGDRQGNVHVLWVEDPEGETNNLVFNPDGSPYLDYRGKQINLLTDSGNTLAYSRWDGQKWLVPVEVQVARYGGILFPSAAVDPYGMLHVIWLSGSGNLQDLVYNRVPAHQAGQVRAWSRQTIISDNLLSAYYPVSIAADSTGGLHILYYRVGDNPGVFAIRSLDGGNNWSSPTMLFANFSPAGDEDGSMPIRLTIDEKDRLHATWTRYDRSGNGKAIYYAYSQDCGETWSEPLEVSFWREGMYEVDWLSVGVSGDQIHLVWEGGPVAYINERMSDDGGQTWSQERRILPRLVGENGWADLATDSSGRVHLIVVKRISQESYTAYGAWHSVWEEGQWASPTMINFPLPNLYDAFNNMQPDAIESMMQGTILGDGLRYPRIVIRNGNEFVVVLVNEHDGDIYASRLMLDSPQIPTEEAAPNPYITPTVVEPTRIPTGESSPTQPVIAFSNPEGTGNIDLQKSLFLSIFPVAVFIVGIALFRILSKRAD